jgi:carbonic anhydrase/acetyltransferase-like protein (isoleucine patch superfamily)
VRKSPEAAGAVVATGAVVAAGAAVGAGATVSAGTAVAAGAMVSAGAAVGVAAGAQAAINMEPSKITLSTDHKTRFVFILFLFSFVQFGNDLDILIRTTS